MQNFNDFISRLQKLIAFKSVKGVKEEGAPFGKEVANALNYFLQQAKEMGFETKNYDNYIGEITYGSGDEIGIIGHVDVVPAGSGWDTDPYVLTYKDGEYYGRGILDDKAPLLCCLYALKELKEQNIECNKKFRLFVGCNEETGWKDVEYLEKSTKIPEYGFSPDGNFPVSYAEKGISIITVKTPPLKLHSSVQGGTVINAVCGYASATPNYKVDESLLKKYELTYNGKEIESVGKSCHGSKPELGINAIEKLYRYFLEVGEDVSLIVDTLFDDKMGISLLQNEQGRVTLSPNLIQNGVVIKCDCRIPAPLSQKDVERILNKTALNYTIQEKHPTQYVDKNGSFVQSMLTAYNEQTGENALPISPSGSTFARVFKKGVAFGPEFPNKPTSIHEPNERVSKEDLIKAYEIYKNAIFKLAKSE